MVTAWGEVVGKHRPNVLDSAAGLLSRFGWDFTEGANEIDQWGTTNRAFLMRVRNPRPFQPTHAYIWNGSVVAGNFDIGVYQPDGTALTRLLSVGSNAQTGTSVLQQVAIASAPVLPAGDLVLALVCTDVTARTGRKDLPTNPTAYIERLIGMAQVESAFPLPTSITGHTSPTGFTEIPIFGVAARLY